MQHILLKEISLDLKQKLVINWKLIITNVSCYVEFFFFAVNNEKKHPQTAAAYKTWSVCHVYCFRSLLEWVSDFEAEKQRISENFVISWRPADDASTTSARQRWVMDNFRMIGQVNESSSVCSTDYWESWDYIWIDGFLRKDELKNRLIGFNYYCHDGDPSSCTRHPSTVHSSKVSFNKHDANHNYKK